MTPIVDGLEKDYGDQVAFKRINADKGDGPRIIREYRILGHPTVLLVAKDGKELQRFIGPQSAEVLTTALNNQLKPTR